MANMTKDFGVKSQTKANTDQNNVGLEEYLYILSNHY